MPRTLPLHRLLTVATLLVAAVALAACGSDSSSGDSTSTTRAAPSSTTTGSNTAAVVVAKPTADLGTILVDAQGRTVYTLTKDGEAVSCIDTCLDAWPPVLVGSGEKTATGGPGVTGLGVAGIASGDQVTSDGLPLYTFAGDTVAGEAKGEGISSFGGTWHVVEVGGTGASTTTPTTAKRSTSGNPDGY